MNLRTKFSVLTLCAAVTMSMMSLGQAASSSDTKPVKIGIIGTGKIGSSLATHWAKAGHEVFVSSRHPEQLKELVASLGPKAHVGTPQEAAAFGEVILISVPYAATPQIGHDYAKELAGKVVIDTGNPYPERDGDMAVEARRKGAGPSSAEFLPGVRLVRAFNAIGFMSLRNESNRAGERYAIPIAGNDAAALAVTEKLVREAGFDPVVVGPLTRAKDFDVGSAVYGKLHTAAELRKEFGL